MRPQRPIPPATLHRLGPPRLPAAPRQQHEPVSPYPPGTIADGMYRFHRDCAAVGEALRRALNLPPRERRHG